MALSVEGVKCICNQLSLTTKIDAEHPELRDYVRSQGWWNGDSDFNFSEVFSLAADHLACCSGRESLEKQSGKCEPGSYFLHVQLDFFHYCLLFTISLELQVIGKDTSICKSCGKEDQSRRHFLNLPQFRMKPLVFLPILI